jgi:hypothetical protein
MRHDVTKRIEVLTAYRRKARTEAAGWEAKADAPHVIEAGERGFIMALARGCYEAANRATILLGRLGIYGG